MARTAADVINLSMAANNPLRASKMSQAVQTVAGDLITAQLFASVVAQQPMLDLLNVDMDGSPLLAQLHMHQLSSRNDAQQFLSSVAPSILASFSDIMAFGTMVDVFLAAATTALSNANDATAFAEVKALVSQLDMRAGTAFADAQNLAAQVSKSQTKMTSDAALLAEDAKTAAATVGSDTGALAKVQSQIDAVNNQIAGQIAGVVVSSLLVVGGGVLIGIGALATLPAGVAGAPVILAGITLTATATAALVVASGALGKSNNELADLYQQSAKLDATLTMIRALSAQLTTSTEAIRGLTTSVDVLAEDWKSIREGISAFSRDIGKALDASDAAYALAAMQIARSDWKAVVAQANALCGNIVDLKPQAMQSAA